MSLEQFFAAYEDRVNRALNDPPEVDIDGTVSAYTECFIEAHPGGTICFQNDEAFRAAVPQLFESQRKLGAKSMKIAHLTLTPLDDYHTMAKVSWEAAYLKQDGSTVTAAFDEIYFVQTLNQTSKVFAYISGDQEKLLQEIGVG